MADISGTSSSDDNLNAGAIAHFASWARIFLARYYAEKGTKLKPTSQAQILMDKLGYLATKTYEVSQLPESDQKEALGKLVGGNEVMVTQALGAAYYFARAIPKFEVNILKGEKQEDTPDPSQKEFSLPNFEKLENGLKASLAACSESYGTQALPNLKPRIAYTSDRPSVVGALFANFTTGLAKTQHLKYSPEDFRSECRRILMAIYYRAFEAGQQKTNARINTTAPEESPNLQ